MDSDHLEAVEKAVHHQVTESHRLEDLSEVEKAAQAVSHPVHLEAEKVVLVDFHQDQLVEDTVVFPAHMALPHFLLVHLVSGVDHQKAQAQFQRMQAVQKD